MNPCSHPTLISTEIPSPSSTHQRKRKAQRTPSRSTTPSGHHDPHLPSQLRSLEIKLRAARVPVHPHQQSACSSLRTNDNDLTALPSDTSGTPLQPFQPVTISINGSNSTNGSTPSSAFSHGTSAQLVTPLHRSTRLGRASHTSTCLCSSAPSTILRRASTDPIIASNTPTSLSCYIQPTSSARQLPTPSSSRPTSSSSSTHSCHLQPNSRSTATRRPASLLCPGNSTGATSSSTLHRHLASSLHSDPALPGFPRVDPLHDPPTTLHHYSS